MEYNYLYDVVMVRDRVLLEMDETIWKYQPFKAQWVYIL
jgi:hypothetical protein